MRRLQLRVCLAPPTLTYFMRQLKSTTRGYVIHPSWRVCVVTHDEHVEDDSRLQKLSCGQLQTQTEMESIFAKNGAETPEPVEAEVRGEFKTLNKHVLCLSVKVQIHFIR